MFNVLNNVTYFVGLLFLDHHLLWSKTYYKEDDPKSYFIKKKIYTIFRVIYLSDPLTNTRIDGPGVKPSRKR